MRVEMKAVLEREEGGGVSCNVFVSSLCLLAALLSVLFVCMCGLGWRLAIFKAWRRLAPPTARRGRRKGNCNWKARMQSLQKYHDLYQHDPHDQLVTADVLAYPHCGPQDGEYEDYKPQTRLYALEYEIGDWFQRSTGEENDLGRVEE